MARSFLTLQSAYDHVFFSQKTRLLLQSVRTGAARMQNALPVANVSAKKASLEKTVQVGTYTLYIHACCVYNKIMLHACIELMLCSIYSSGL